jgi:hypothetical protein
VDRVRLSAQRSMHCAPTPAGIRLCPRGAIGSSLPEGDLLTAEPQHTKQFNPLPRVPVENLPFSGLSGMSESKEPGGAVVWTGVQVAAGG